MGNQNANIQKVFGSSAIHEYLKERSQVSQLRIFEGLVQDHTFMFNEDGTLNTKGHLVANEISKFCNELLTN